jgi:lactoylglutathione lyase
MKFNWITLHVKDLDRSAAFYGDYLGMKLAREFTQPGGRHFKFYEAANGMQVELIGGGGETVSASNLSLGVAVSDYDALLAKAREEGFISGEPRILGGHLECFFALDPDGVQIQIARG